MLPPWLEASVITEVDLSVEPKSPGCRKEVPYAPLQIP